MVFYYQILHVTIICMSKTSHQKHEQKNQNHKNRTKIKHIPEDDVLTEHKFGTEVVIGLIIFALGMFFMVPFYSATTAPIQLAILALFMLAVLAFIITHWRKLKKQSNHPQMPALERFIYLSIVAILSVAIFVQVLTKSLDLWLVFILVIVVLLKIFLLSRTNRN